MGLNKALSPFLGQLLIQRIVDQFSAVADEIIITTNQPEKFRFLGLPMFQDVLPGKGALGGLYTALLHAGQPLLGVVACDMPFANPALLQHQAELMGRSDIVIPLLPGGYEPMHAVYRRATCLPVVEQALQGNQLKIISLFPSLRVHPISREECLQFDPDELSFINVNTPQELQAAEATALARLSAPPAPGRERD